MWPFCILWSFIKENFWSVGLSEMLFHASFDFKSFQSEGILKIVFLFKSNASLSSKPFIWSSKSRYHHDISVWSFIIDQCITGNNGRKGGTSCLGILTSWLDPEFYPQNANIKIFYFCDENAVNWVSWGKFLTFLQQKSIVLRFYGGLRTF